MVQLKSIDQVVFLRSFLLLFLVGITNSNCVSAQKDKQFFTSFDGTHIAFKDEGKGFPVILLHGFLNTSESWERTKLKGELLENGYRVIVPDMRGMGDSDKPQDDEGYKGDTEIQDIKSLADYLGLTSYHAVGYSRGSIVLAKLLVSEPRIEKAVLGGMGIDFTNPRWSRRIMFSEAFDGKKFPETEGAVNYAKKIGADLRSLHLQQKYQPVTSMDELKKIKAEVLVLCGDRDPDNGSASELAEAIPGSELTLVEGVHDTALRTEEFSRNVLAFFKK